QVVSFLKRKPASMQVAIFVLGTQLELLQGFTTEREKLLHAMSSRAGGIRTVSISEQVLRAQATLDAFVELGKFLSGQTGRKNLLWFSGSFEMLQLPEAGSGDHELLLVNQPDQHVPQG